MHLGQFLTYQHWKYVLVYSKYQLILILLWKVWKTCPWLYLIIHPDLDLPRSRLSGFRKDISCLFKTLPHPANLIHSSNHQSGPFLGIGPWWPIFSNMIIGHKTCPEAEQQTMKVIYYLLVPFVLNRHVCCF